MRKTMAFVGVVALFWGAFAPAASARPNQLMACTPYANAPFKSGSTVTGKGGQTGTCTNTVSINLKRQRTGPDQVLKTGSRTGPGGITVYQACDWPGSYGLYVEAFQPNGSIVLSNVVETTC